MYDSSAHLQDRHRRDISMLQLWVNYATPEAYHELFEVDDSPAATRRAGLWNGDTFSKMSYICAMIAKALGAECDSPYDRITDLIRKEWARFNGMPFLWKKILI